MEFRIRILDIKIKNIKNVKEGEIEFDSFKDIKKGLFDLSKADIKGVYGPNGSSKTTIIDSFKILKDIILNSDLHLLNANEVYNLMNKESNESSIELTLLDDSNNKKIYYYEINLIKDEINKKTLIKKESLSFKEYSTNLNKYQSKNKLFEIDYLNKNLNNIIKPISSLSIIKKNNKNNLLDLIKLLAISETSNSSFIFNESFINLLNNIDEFNEFKDLLSRFKSFVIYNMHIFTLKDLSSITSNDIIPIFYKDNNKYNKLEINLFNENIIDISLKESIIKYFKEIDLVINKIIPLMHVDLIDLGKSILDNGNIGFKFEIISIRNEIKIPLKLESDGIKKIITLISSLIDIYNNKYSILIVDEFDSGIFEYLLGELLKSIKEDAKGILLFTSHNLRALEIIKDSIIFSSTFENNRYISYPRISKTENLRNQYLKKLFLDSPNKFGEHLDTYEISRSFKKAGELL